MFKDGDIIYCKKDYTDGNVRRKEPFFSAGESYVIRHVTENYITIHFKCGGWTTFNIEDRSLFKDYDLVYDYFYTQKGLMYEIQKR